MMCTDKAAIPADLAELYSKCKPLVEYMQKKYPAGDALIVTGGRVSIFKQFIDIPLSYQSEWLENVP